MICPQCKAEYRQGFTMCADCEVPLIANPIEWEGVVSKPVPSGTVVPLWEGEDLALHTSLLEELDAAGIPYYDRPMGVFPGLRRGDHFPIQPMSRFGYQLAVLSSNLSAGRRILERLLEERPQDVDLPAQVEQTSSTPEAPARGDEELGSEIWTGQDDALFGFLRDALRENGIPLRMEALGSEKRVYVHASDALRAREIVREVTEGAPPE
jgi:hypothetical protein